MKGLLCLFICRCHCRKVS